MFKRLQWRLVVCEIVVLALAPTGAYAQGPFARFVTFLGGNSPAPGPQGHMQPSRSQFGPGGQPGFNENTVELAWTADPVTFPYALSARTSGNTLQVEGFVPNENVRQRALWLAKRNTTLTVLDGTRMHPGLAVPTPRYTPALQQKAIEAVRATVPQHAHNLRLSAGNNGCVTISGTVASYEEKVAVGHAMKQVAGCTSVNNMIQATGAGPESAYNQQPQNSRGGFLPFNTPPIVKSTMSRFGFGQNNQPPLQQPPADYGQQYAAENSQPQQAQYSPHEYTSPYSAAPQAETRQQTQWRQASPSQEHMTRPASHTMQVSADNSGRTPSPYGVQPERNDGPPVIARSDVQQVRPASTAPYIRPTPAESPLQIEQPPVVKNEAASPPPPNAKLPKLSTAQLRQRIEQACAGQVRGVNVEYDSSDKLNVKMQLMEGAQQQQVIERVFAIPDLLPYQGQIQISLDLPMSATPTINEAPRR